MFVYVEYFPVKTILKKTRIGFDFTPEQFFNLIKKLTSDHFTPFVQQINFEKLVKCEKFSYKLNN